MVDIVSVASSNDSVRLISNDDEFCCFVSGTLSLSRSTLLDIQKLKFQLSCGVVDGLYRCHRLSSFLEHEYLARAK